MKKVGDLLGIGLVLISIFIMALAWRDTDTLVKLTGLIGGVIIFVVEGWYVLKSWRLR